MLAHSLGAVAAGVALASGWVSAERLVLVAPLTEVQTQLHAFARLLRLGRRTRDRLPDEVTAHTGLTVEELTLNRLLDRAAARPTLLVHDRDDRFTPCQPTVELARRWPDTELVLTTGLGHTRLLADPDVRDHIVSALVGSGAMLSA